MNVRANQKGLYDNLEIWSLLPPSAGDDAAQMIYDAMNAVMVQYDISSLQLTGCFSHTHPERQGGRQTLMSSKFNTRRSENI